MISLKRFKMPATPRYTANPFDNETTDRVWVISAWLFLTALRCERR